MMIVFMIETSQLLETTLWGAPYGSYVVSGLIIVATILLKGLFTKVIFGGLCQITKKTTADWDDHLLDSLRKPIAATIVLLGVFIALNTFPTRPEVGKDIDTIFRALFTIAIVWGINRFIGVGARLLQQKGQEKGMAIATFVPLFKQMVVVIIWIIGLIMVFDTFGFSVASIIAALGIGGAALAFASQDTIANLYGSVAIALDRPFKVGDAVKIGSADAGVIENIGMRSTQVRTFTKSLISIPNNKVANDMIDNFTLMTNRRINPVIGVEYGTTKEQITNIIEDMKALMKQLGDEGLLLEEPQWVYLAEFGDSSINIMTVCYTTAGGFLEFLQAREKFNYGVMEIVEKHGSSFAFPTRTVHMFNHSAQESVAAGEILPPKA